MRKQQIGIIDMGSNSVRFVIYSVDENGCFKEIQNLKIVARLSTYINNEGNMTLDGIDIILETLARFQMITFNYQLDVIKGVATAAIRNAKNQSEIISAIKNQGYFHIEVLSDYKEAYYGYLAITNSTNIIDGISIDIGGGSTEVTLFEERTLIASHSFPFGALTLKEAFIQNGDPTEGELKKLENYLIQAFNTLPWLKCKTHPIIGIGGTARNLANIHQQIVNYPLSGLHQYEMADKDVTLINEKLRNLTLKQRQQVEGLSKDRADIIIPAITAIEKLIDHTGGNQFIISNKGLRDGLFYEIVLKQIGITHFPNTTEESVYQLSHMYNLDLQFHKRIAILATFLIKQLQSLNIVSITKDELKIIQWAAKVFYIGASIHPESKSQHTFYLITNQSIDGLSHDERLAVAFISSFKSRSLLKKFAEPFSRWVTAEELKSFELFGAIIKLCYGLDVSKRNIVKSIELSEDSLNKLTIQIFYDKDAYFEKYYARKYKKHLEKALSKEIEIQFSKVK
ncbi:Ppx/GppA phosphatase family protein [Evansella halocellulosilytica]|uniref:Ppx/GppA phosphatase family protein n=1 Tax=Evansella halocellulosilytica TaxID=2011013 RepID=UPI000BB8532F|nr:Ppx/GppA phosphatase family protein [Evansella halocellulosilytica]